MDATRLLIFKTIADKGSFSKAAEALHLSQPATSLAVQALEEHYGVKLFRRTSRGAILTEAGQLLYSYACQILSLYEAAEQTIRQCNQTRRLAVGASTTIGEALLPRLCVLFANLYPEIQIMVEIANAEEVVGRLQENLLDMALVEFPVNNSGFVAQPFTEDQLVVVVSSSHPWAKRQSVRLSQLRRQPLILREEGSGTRKFLSQALVTHGTSLREFNIIMTLGSNQAIKEAVQFGMGIAILSRWTVAKECYLGLLHSLEVEDLALKREFYCIIPKHNSPNPCSRLFLDLITSPAFSQTLRPGFTSSQTSNYP